jgi:hypothetical protein
MEPECGDRDDEDARPMARRNRTRRDNNQSVEENRRELAKSFKLGAAVVSVSEHDLEESGDVPSASGTDSSDSSEASLSSSATEEEMRKDARRPLEPSVTEPPHRSNQMPTASVVTDRQDMEVATISEPSLEDPPGTNDARVRQYKNGLKADLRLENIMVAYKNTASFLRIAVNAAADRVEPLIKIQNGLFEILKVCDATSIMMQSFKSGANNILEKLRVAYLYILDGFPDFAKIDIDSISKDIKTMKDKGQTALNAVRSAIGLINAAETCTSNEWKTRRNDTKSETMTLRHRLILRTLVLAKARLNSALASLGTTEGVAERWYSECKDIVEPAMAKNFQAADKLPRNRQEQFWSPLQFKKEAVGYLCR